MPTTIRILLLLCCVAAGAVLATAFALHGLPAGVEDIPAAMPGEVSSAIGFPRSPVNTFAEEIPAAELEIEPAGSSPVSAQTSPQQPKSQQELPKETIPRAPQPEDFLAEPQFDPLIAPLPPVIAEIEKPFGRQVESLEQRIQKLQSEGGSPQYFEQVLKQAPGIVPLLTGNQMLQNAVPNLGETLQRAAEKSQGNSAGGEAEQPLLPKIIERPAIVKSEGDGLLTINLQGSDIRGVLEMLGEQGDLNILAGKSVKGSVSASLKNVDVLTALEAILTSTGFSARQEGDFIYVGTSADFLEMDQVRQRIGSRVYRPNYVSAQELQTLITPMLTENVGKVTVSNAADKGIAPDTAAAGGNDFAGGEVVLVRDYESVLHQVDQILLEIDRMPLQVSIEAKILSVKLDDSLTAGIDFAALGNRVAAVSGTDVNSLAQVTVGNGGLKFGFLSGSMGTLVTALETIGDTNVIASPHLMCLNKQRAEILIGQQLGYVSTTQTETAATQSVEFLEVGTQLLVRPFVSADGMVRLEVHPELSTGSVRVEGGFTLPDKDVTQVTTNIMCRDGATVVIGGLIRNELSDTGSQVPFFGNLPVMGVMFRKKTQTTDRREIVVLLTPRIVREEFAHHHAAQVMCDHEERQAVYADKMSPLGKRYLGRRHYRMAVAAYEAGDALEALRHANLAIQFDPQNGEAIALRAEVVTTTPYGDESVDKRLREGLAPWQRPNYSYSHCGGPWTKNCQNPSLPGAPLELPSPGVPGSVRDLQPLQRP